MRPETKEPVSFIMMDGWFPCLMPYDDREQATEEFNHKYVMTHGKWTIVGSYPTYNMANDNLASIDDPFIHEHVRKPSEEHMEEFWPGFTDRFRYVGWKGGVLAKIKTNREFRGTVVFQDPDTSAICIFPGKITNIFSAEREVSTLMASRKNVLTTEGDYKYVKDGVLDSALDEISEQLEKNERNTCELQTFRNLLEQRIQKTEKELEQRGEDIEQYVI
jgi:hypothetical protein